MAVHTKVQLDKAEDYTVTIIHYIHERLMLSYSFKDNSHKYLFLPDFSDRGKRRARKSWIRPQKTVF